ncbi:hypothetical protein SSX86_001630 [Deinandra increscens subsp. villosa]|uniref:Uncharacterized protein n=1 Tax=Deinandra increscens subsp. villosa TaxID=3103831 RepID=A0AAP0DV73_9ASTR
MGVGLSILIGLESATLFIVFVYLRTALGFTLLSVPFLYASLVSLLVSLASHPSINLPMLLGKNTDGSFPIWPLIMFSPYLYLVRTFSTLQRLKSREDPYSEEVNGLFVGGWPSSPEKMSSGNPAVVDCTCELPRVFSVSGNGYLCVPTWDTRSPDPGGIESTVKWACRKRAQNIPVFVHCAYVHGTWVSGRRIEPGVHMVLKEGDTVKIGGSSRVYELHWVPLTQAYDGQFVPTFATIKEGKEEETHQDEKHDVDSSEDDVEGSDVSLSNWIHDSPLKVLNPLTSSVPNCYSSDTVEEHSQLLTTGNENDVSVSIQAPPDALETTSATDVSNSQNNSEDQLNWLRDNLIKEDLFSMPNCSESSWVLKSMFRRKSSGSPPRVDAVYLQPDVVEELIEEGSALLSERLHTKYPLCNLFKLFTCAVCQKEMKPGEGISILAASGNLVKPRPWDVPLSFSYF